MAVLERFVPVVFGALALPAFAGSVSVPDVVFGVTERTPYCALDERAGVYTVAFWLQDVKYTLGPDHVLILRYTTSDVTHPVQQDPTAYSGNMSVYEVQGGRVHVLAEYRIKNNADGAPVWIDGIQQYVPKKPFSPAVVEGRVPYVENTFGSYKYCPVPRNPFSGIPEGLCVPWDMDHSWTKYVVALTADADTVRVVELYWQSFSDTDFARLFVYDARAAGRTLVSAYDFPTNTMYYRYRTVTNGVCTDRG